MNPHLVYILIFAFIGLFGIGGIAWWLIRLGQGAKDR